MNPTLTITLDAATGQVQVAGPIDNKMICYGLLEMAKDAIRDYAAAQAKQGGLIAVKGSLPGQNGTGF